MSSEKPLEVFYRVEAGEISEVTCARDGLPAAVPFALVDRLEGHLPRFYWLPAEEIRVTLDRRP